MSDNYPGNQTNEPGGGRGGDESKYPAGQQWQQPPSGSQGGPYGQEGSGQQNPYGQQDGYGQTPYGQGGPGGYGQPVENPGKTLGIVGFILSLIPLLNVVGLIVSIVAMVKSRKARMGNGWALAGIIIGTLAVIATIVLVILTIALFPYLAEVAEFCQQAGPGEHTFQGEPIECP